MKKIYTFILASIIALGAAAQTTHNVTVFNFGFDPPTLDIAPGDIVVWTNTEGFHNVDGNLTAFPENPSAFGNDASSDLWTYEFTFDDVGTYNYQCEVHPSQMQGVVNVVGPNSVNDENREALQAYPSPADEFITLQGVDGLKGQSIFEVFDITGKKAMQRVIAANDQINIRTLNSGIYIFNLTTNDGRRFAGKIVIN